MRHRAGKKRPSNLQTCFVENRRFDTVGRQQNTRNATQPNDYRAIERELRRKTGKGTPQTRLGLSPIRRWNDDDFDVLADGVVVGRIMKAAAVPVGQSWMWTLAFGHHEHPRRRTATRRLARPR
jgi:hypothetical protein